MFPRLSKRGHAAVAEGGVVVLEEPERTHDVSYAHEIGRHVHEPRRYDPFLSLFYAVLEGLLRALNLIRPQCVFVRLVEIRGARLEDIRPRHALHAVDCRALRPAVAHPRGRLGKPPGVLEGSRVRAVPPVAVALRLPPRGGRQHGKRREKSEAPACRASDTGCATHRNRQPWESARFDACGGAALAGIRAPMSVTARVDCRRHSSHNKKSVYVHSLPLADDTYGCLPPCRHSHIL